MTLVEVMMAVVLLAGAAVFALQSMAAVSHAMALSDSRSAAYDFSVSKMAEVALEAEETGVLEEGRGSFRAGDQRFEWRITVGSAAPDLSLYNALLTVSWKQAGQEHQTRTSTLWRRSDDQEQD